MLAEANPAFWGAVVGLAGSVIIAVAVAVSAAVVGQTKEDQSNFFTAMALGFALPVITACGALCALSYGWGAPDGIVVLGGSVIFICLSFLSIILLGSMRGPDTTSSPTATEPHSDAG